MGKKAKKDSSIKSVIRIIVTVLAVAFCIFFSLLLFQFVSNAEQVELWMKEHSYIGWLAYILMVVLQVMIALIPGEPLEIAGGYVFGPIEGTILNLIGATIGSLLVFAAVRKFGNALLEVFFSKEQICNLRFLKSSKKRNILLVVIFILPGTPKDLLCYFAGLTDIKLKVWFWVCSLGRLPSVVTSMLGGEALETGSYEYAILVLCITVFISLLGALVYRSVCKSQEKK